jgi:hypothetical protein
MPAIDTTNMIAVVKMIVIHITCGMMMITIFGSQMEKMS